MPLRSSPRSTPRPALTSSSSLRRPGLPQIYKMNIDGADIQRLTNGEGEATNPPGINGKPNRLRLDEGF